MINLSREIAAIVEDRKVRYLNLENYSDSESREFDQRFFEFFAKMTPPNDVEAVVELLRSFDDALDDFGTQELVCGIVRELPSHLFIEGLMLYFNQMVDVAPEWLFLLLTDRKLAGAQDLEEMQPELRSKCSSLLEDFQQH